MWILINWSNWDGSDILPVDDSERTERTKKFTSKDEALKWAGDNLNFNYHAIKI